MMYSNIGLCCRETVPLNRPRQSSIHSNTLHILTPHSFQQPTHSNSLLIQPSYSFQHPTHSNALCSFQHPILITASYSFHRPFHSTILLVWGWPYFFLFVKTIIFPYPRLILYIKTFPPFPLLALLRNAYTPPGSKTFSLYTYILNHLHHGWPIYNSAFPNYAFTPFTPPSRTA